MRMNPASRPIYLDYHATTPTDPRVAAIVHRHMTEVFGNANSVDHSFGDEALAAVEAARRSVATLIEADPRSIVFTSGATESLNLALQGLVRAFRSQGQRGPLRVGLLPVEHLAVIETCQALAEAGELEPTYFAVDQRGRLDLEDVEAKCRNGLHLVCVMAANNEIGTLYPIEDAARIAHQHGAIFLTDATQAAGKIPIRFNDWGIDLLALSAHKMYGPKGIGALVIAPGVRLKAPLFGGGHQGGRRSGTLNVPGIVGLGEACRLRQNEMVVDEPRIATQRDHLERLLIEGIPELAVNGDPERRLAGNLHVSVSGIPNGPIIARLRNMVALSTGAACSSGIEAPSHVLRALALPADAIDGALRIGLGKFTTDDEVERAAREIISVVTDVRTALSPA